MVENILENALLELKKAQKETKEKFEDLYRNTSNLEEKKKIEGYFAIYKQLEDAIESKNVSEIYQIIKQLEDANNN